MDLMERMMCTSSVWDSPAVGVCERKLQSILSNRLLRLWVRIPPGAWMFVEIVVCCVVEIPGPWLSHDSCRQPQTYVKPEAAITVLSS
jgi:hypothetical protein